MFSIQMDLDNRERCMLMFLLVSYWTWFYIGFTVAMCHSLDMTCEDQFEGHCGISVVSKKLVLHEAAKNNGFSETHCHCSYGNARAGSVN